MSTPYGVSRNIGSSTYNNYVNAPIIGPLSTNQYPCAMPYHSYGILPGRHPNPPLFYPSQEPAATDQNVNSRHQFWRTAESAKSMEQKRKIQIAKSLSGFSGGIYTDMSTQRQYATSGHTNYIPPIDSSMRIQKLRSNAVGKSGYKIGLPAAVPYGTKSYDRSFTNTALRRARSGGCVAPKKKGAIENYSLRNGMVCAWGSLPRQNY